MNALRYLADTHVLLWALADDRRLLGRHKSVLLSSAEVYFSAASIWEIAIKRSLGKLQAPQNLAALLPRAGFIPLDLTPRHTEAVSDLPRHHGDPFDRLLIVQAMIEKMCVMTVDTRFSHYGVDLL